MNEGMEIPIVIIIVLVIWLLFIYLDRMPQLPEPSLSLIDLDRYRRALEECRLRDQGSIPVMPVPNSVYEWSKEDAEIMKENRRTAQVLHDYYFPSKEVSK